MISTASKSLKTKYKKNIPSNSLIRIEIIDENPQRSVFKRWVKKTCKQIRSVTHIIIRGTTFPFRLC